MIEQLIGALACLALVAWTCATCYVAGHSKGYLHGLQAADRWWRDAENEIATVRREIRQKER